MSRSESQRGPRARLGGARRKRTRMSGPRCWPHKGCLTMPAWACRLRREEQSRCELSWEVCTVHLASVSETLSFVRHERVNVSAFPGQLTASCTYKLLNCRPHSPSLGYTPNATPRSASQLPCSPFFLDFQSLSPKPTTCPALATSTVTTPAVSVCLHMQEGNIRALPLFR